MSPPAPLAHPMESLEQLWSSVQGKMQYFGDHIGDNVHSLPDTFDLSIGVLQDALHESMAAMQSQLHENMEHARDSLHLRMEPFSKKMHKSFSALSDVLHVFQGSLENMAGSVHIRLSTLRTNLEKSFNAVQEGMHSIQHDLTDNLGAARSHLKKSLAGLQEHLSGLQTLLHDTKHSQEEVLAFNDTSGMNQCPSATLSLSASGLKSVGDRVDRWPVFVYMSGAMLCLLVSSVCHWFACCCSQQHTFRYMWRFDYAGISVLIVTSFYPAIYYGFLCQPHWVIFYLGITTMLGVGAIVASLVSFMQRPKFRPLRAGMFVGMGLFGVIPWAHNLIINFHEPTIRTAVVYEMLMAAFYLGGAAFFVYRVPERFSPGAFDIVLNSHQIFHIFVVIAACIHFQAVMHLLQWRESTNGCPLP